MKTSITGLAVSAFGIATNALARGPGDEYGMGPGMMWGYGVGWHFPYIMLVVWIVLILGIVALVRWIVVSMRQGPGDGRGESALDILKKRYAKGEIDKEEFEAKKKDLESS